MHLTLKRLEGPREFRGQVEWGMGTFMWRQGIGEKVWDVEQLEGGQVTRNKIWSAKK